MSKVSIKKPTTKRCKGTENHILAKMNWQNPKWGDKILRTPGDGQQHRLTDRLGNNNGLDLPGQSSLDPDHTPLRQRQAGNIPRHKGGCFRCTSLRNVLGVILYNGAVENAELDYTNKRLGAWQRFPWENSQRGKWRKRSQT